MNAAASTAISRPEILYLNYFWRTYKYAKYNKITTEGPKQIPFSLLYSNNINVNECGGEHCNPTDQIASKIPAK